jgi:hypothetical protein
MKRTLVRWPTLGFFLMVASYGLLIAVLAWGFSQPELDRAWHILEGMKRDNYGGLTRAEAETLSTLLVRHPGFAQALVGRAPVGWVEPTEDGWTALRSAHLVIQANPVDQLRVAAECRAPKAAYPVTVAFRADGLKQELRYEQDGRQTFDLPAGQPAQALWVEVTIDSARPGATGAAPAELRITADKASGQKAAP